MKCEITLTETGQVIKHDDLVGLIQNAQATGINLDKALLLYSLETESSEEQGRLNQERVINILTDASVKEVTEKDKVIEDDEMVNERPLDDRRVTDRAAIVVNKGSTRGFDKKWWEDKIKDSIRDRIKKAYEYLDELELEERTEKSFLDVKAYNDNSSKLGHDIHLIAEIVFGKNAKNAKDVLDIINDSKIKFETETFNAEDGKKSKMFYDTVDFMLSFKHELETKYKGCKFLSEKKYRQKVSTEGTYASIKSEELSGVVDLIMVDASGKVHLYDFKSTTKGYNEWSNFKQDITAVQLYTYKMMFGTLGVPVTTMECVVVPCTIDNSYNEETQSYKYELTGIESFNSSKHIVNVKPRRDHQKIVENWFPQRYYAPKPEEWLATDKVMSEIFITGSFETESNDEELDYYFTKNAKGELIPDEVKLSEFRFYEYKKGHRYYGTFQYAFETQTGIMRCKDLADFRLKLKNELDARSSSRLADASRIAYAFAEEYDRANGEPDKINYSNILGPKTDQQSWLKREISHYLESGEFELHTDKTYLDQGYLLWKHKTLGFVECVLVSSDPLMQTKRLAKGTTILGKILDDGHVDKKEIMSATNANIALMRFMNFMATSPNTRKWCTTSIGENGKEEPCKIASIRVINPNSYAKEVRPNLQFILSNYEALCDNAPNLLKSKELKRIDRSIFYGDAQALALQAIAQCAELQPIYNDFDTTKFTYDYGKVDDVLDFINKCISQLVNDKNRVEYQNLENFNPADPNWRAIFYLINIQNALHGHTYIAEMGTGKWFNSGSPTGLMISAPGMSTSTTLRTFDEINKAYVDSVVQAVNKHGASIKQAFEDLYREQNMDSLLGGPSNSVLYYGMFETNSDGLVETFKLKSPKYALSDGQRKVIEEFMILNWRLTTLAQGSKKALDTLTEQERKNILENPEWLYVPLMDAAFSRQLYNHHKTSGSWLETVKFAVVNKWRELGNLYNDVMVDDLDTDAFKEELKKSINGAYVIDRRSTWNMFDYTKNPSKRSDLLAKFGPERFETNLEIVANNMLVAYFKQFYSKRYAAQLSALRLELAYAQKAGHSISDVIDVFDLAVRTKFYGESPIPEQIQHIYAPLARLKSVFSMLQIGGKAVSMLKEIVYGTFIGFSNAVGKGLPGLNAETYWKAFKYVTSEVFKSSKGVGKLNHLQMQYHIANYGLHQIADQRRSNFLGLRNWGTDTLFLTATSPDFFHRSIVLVAKMMADGSWDAYDFDEKANNGSGQLTYDVMKDARFAKFTKKDPNLNDPEYWQQKAMFEQYVSEFNKLGITDENGNKLTVERDDKNNYYLPRPYLQREVDTFKNYADMLYGHYDDESKALVNDTFLGSFWLQYKTFVTAKIERYGMKPGVYNTHLLKQQYLTKPDGTQEALYLKTVWEDNELHRYVIPESELSEEDKKLRELGTAGNSNGESVTAYIKWEGIPMEGILQSMGSISRTIKRLLMGDKEALQEFKLIWDDPTKRGNFIVAFNDLIFMGLLGMIGSALFGMHNGLDFSEAWNNEAAVRQLVRAGNWAQNGLYDVFVGAMQDGPITNTISSMFQAPPIMTSIERAWKDSIDLLTGDSSAFEFLTSEIGALRIFDGMAQAAAVE